jgi:hypothetical protein
LKLRRRKRQLQVIDDPVHHGILRDESDDPHRPPALGAKHGGGCRVRYISYTLGSFGKS